MNLKEVIEQKPHARIEIFETLKREDAIMLDRDPITNARLICPRILLNPLDYRDYRFTVDPTFSKVQFHIDRIKKVGFDLERKKKELFAYNPETT